MTPDSPIDPRSALESRLTALLLGELPHAEAAALHQKLAHDPELAALYERLKHTMSLVRETLSSPAQPTADQPAPLKLSEDRRQKLLQHFKTVPERAHSDPRVPAQPQTRTGMSALRREYPRPRKNRVLALVELAAAAAVIMLLAALFLPAFSKAKSKSMRSLGIGPSFSLETESTQLAQMARASARPSSSAEGLYRNNGDGTFSPDAKPLAQLVPPPAETAGSVIVLPKSGETEVAQAAFSRRYGLPREPVPMTQGETLSGGMGGGGYVATSPAAPPVQSMNSGLDNQMAGGAMPTTPPTVSFNVGSVPEPAGVPAETLGKRFGGVSGSGAVPVPSGQPAGSETFSYYAINDRSSGNALQWSFDGRPLPGLSEYRERQSPCAGRCAGRWQIMAR